MKETIKIEYTPEPSSSELSILTNGISFEALQKKHLKKIKSYAFFLKDNAGEVKGGINGNILYGCLAIDQLWVSPELRGKHYGIQLMQQAEAFAIQNDCRFAIVNTMDWEAKDFYIKLGYKVEFQQTGFDENSTCYLLKKEIK